MLFLIVVGRVEPAAYAKNLTKNELFLDMPLCFSSHLVSRSLSTSFALELVDDCPNKDDAVKAETEKDMLILVS